MSHTQQPIGAWDCIFLTNQEPVIHSHNEHQPIGARVCSFWTNQRRGSQLMQCQSRVHEVPPSQAEPVRSASYFPDYSCPGLRLIKAASLATWDQLRPFPVINTWQDYYREKLASTDKDMGDNVSFKVFLKGTDEEEVCYNNTFKTHQHFLTVVCCSRFEGSWLTRRWAPATSTWWASWGRCSRSSGRAPSASPGQTGTETRWAEWHESWGVHSYTMS